MKASKEERDQWSPWKKIICKCFRESRIKGCKGMSVCISVCKTEFSNSAVVDAGSLCAFCSFYFTCFLLLDSIVLYDLCFHKSVWLKGVWIMVVGPNPLNNERVQRLLMIFLNQNSSFGLVFLNWNQIILEIVPLGCLHLNLPLAQLLFSLKQI